MIVDSSKFPSYAWLLGKLPGIDLHILHLIRDVRGVVYSWSHRTKLRRDLQGKQARLPRLHPLGVTIRWAFWNQTIEFFWKRNPERYSQVRYEDFVESPESVLRSLLDSIQEDVPKLPITGERTAILVPTHSTTGNPSRFELGEVDLVQDVRWKTGLEKTYIFLCTLLTFPWLRKYGYPFLSLSRQQ